MIETEPDAVQDLYAYVGLKDFIAGLFTEPVDVIDRNFLKENVRLPAEAESVYAF